MNSTLLMLSAGAEKFSNMDFGERAAESLKVSALGLGTVFAVLAILWGILEIFRFICYDIPNKNKKASAEAVSEKPVVVTADDASESDGDGEIVAAITAAVAVVLDRPTSSFRVVSFRKTGTK